MNHPSKYTIGIRYGLIIGLMYMILLFLRYRVFASNPQSYFVFSIASYLLVIFMYLLAAIARKKELGGYAELKEIFQSVFIAILIAEFCYVVFNLVYMKFVDPQFFERFESIARNYYQGLHYTPDQLDMSMKGVKTIADGMKPKGLITGYGTAVILDCIFAFIFAGILRKKKINPEQSIS